MARTWRSGRGSVNITGKDDSERVAKSLQLLANAVVLVGIPAPQEQPHYNEGGKRAGSARRIVPDITNAVLGYIHEYGSPPNNIPARPWLLPGVVVSKKEWTEYLRQAGKAAFEGKMPVMDRAMHAAGMTAVGSTKTRITAGLQPPLSQRTIDARRRRVKSRKATSAADVTPLVDTAQMLNSISYVIRYKQRGPPIVFPLKSTGGDEEGV